MRQFINYHSLLLILAGLLITLIIVWLRAGKKPIGLLFLGGLVLVLLVGWWLYRPPATPDSGKADLQARLASGTPTLLEFQSPY